MAMRVAIVFAGAAIVAIVVATLAGLGGSDPPGNGGVESPRAVLHRAAHSRSPTQDGYEVAIVEHRTALRVKPRGHVLARIGRRTEFGSARVLPVLQRRAGWLRVMAAERPNGKTAWIDERDTSQARIHYRMRTDISARRIDVMRRGDVVRRIHTAVGEQGTPTPHGTFAVTDKIPFTDPASPYGCCALALSAHQPDTPSTWSGGDRIAIHATPKAETIGRAVTLGCLRVPAADARWLMRHIPLGTQVSIRA